MYYCIIVKKITKLLTLALFSIGSLVRTHSKHEVTQKGGRDRRSNKSVNRLSLLIDFLGSPYEIPEY